MLSPKCELRHLPATKRHQLVCLLDINDNWKVLAARLPNPDRPNEPLLQSQHISVLEEQRKRNKGSPSNALLEYWSTYGRTRHTVSDAIHFLKQCDLQRAADVIEKDIHISHTSSNHLHDDCANSESKQHTSIEKADLWWCDATGVTDSEPIMPTAPNKSFLSFSTVDQQNSVFLPNKQPSNFPSQFAYHDIELATNYFNSKPLPEGGNKLGEGSFGEVFFAKTSLMNYHELTGQKHVAVKRFKQLPGINQDNHYDGQFVCELQIMCRFQHPNLVRLYGYSNDGPQLCIVTEYLEKGSLQSFLVGEKHRPEIILSFAQRLQISADIADALVYLHNYTQTNELGQLVVKPFIHRDIKSANIFLDKHFVAHLGDLGLVRQGSNSNTCTTMVTNTIIGTSVYMAPEAFRGDISVKIDTFSFGVVLLELLTGMTAFYATREESDIISYFDQVLGDELDKLENLHGDDLLSTVNLAAEQINHQIVASFLDSSCVDWQLELASRLIMLARNCIEQRKKNRPTMDEVIVVLRDLLTIQTQTATIQNTG